MFRYVMTLNAKKFKIVSVSFKFGFRQSQNELYDSESEVRVMSHRIGVAQYISDILVKADSSLWSPHWEGTWSYL